MTLQTCTIEKGVQMSHDTVYDSAPWTRHYKRGLDLDLASPHQNLVELLSAGATACAGEIAYTAVVPNGMNGSLRFRQVEEMSDAFAVYLREVLGLARGARVALQMPNCLTYPVAALGILKAGCVLVNVNPLYTEREMEHQLNDAGAEAIVIIDMFSAKLAGVLPRTRVRHVVITSLAQWFPLAVRVVLKAILKYWSRVIPALTFAADGIDAALAKGRAARRQKNISVRDYWKDVGPADTCALQYTGGTTGVSKGAVLSHGNLLTNLMQLDRMAGEHFADGKETMLTVLPLYHIFAFTLNFLFCYVHGARNILVPNPRPIQNCQRAIENYRITWVAGVNTFYNALLNEEWFYYYPPKSLKVAVAGGAALHQSVAERWERVTGNHIAEGYGLTETSPVLAFNPIGDKSTPGSIGIPVPGTQVRIVDDAGRSVAPGEHGEIAVRGGQVMSGYWNRPDETAKALRDGWFLTGDVAFMDSHFYFRIVDRKKDMILVSGFNVYPNEVEDCIARIDSVLEAAVIGVPDEHSGEVVCAFVVRRDPTLTAEDVREFCRGELAPYKVPKHVEFRSELPKTPVGKVLRKDLRAQVAAAPGRRPDSA
jgi:long-chain acyl-CoA synthetase